MASRVAPKLKQELETDVKTEKGGLGEFSVTVDGEKVVNTNRLLYPNPSSVIKRVRTALGRDGG
jgi:hypothetical protein